MSKQGVVSIGLNVDYQKSLREMTSAFTSELTKLSNEAKKLKFSKDITDQINAVSQKVDSVTSEFRTMFDEFNNNKLDASKFTTYQDRITKEFSKIETSISGITSQISAMDEKIGMLSGADIASGIKKQFDDLKDSLLSTYQGLEKVFDLAKSSSSRLSGAIDSSALKDYKATLAEVRKAQKEIDNLDFSGSSDDDLFDRLSREEEMLNKQMATYKELKAEMSATSKGSPQFSTIENNLIRVQMAISKTSETIQELDSEIASRDLGAGMEDDTQSIINSIKHFDTEIDNFVASTQKMIQANKEAQNSIEQTQAAFNTFQIKNGAIHVPVEVATKDSTLQKQLQETIDKLQEYAQKNSIIAKVKLTLDKSSSKGYKSNSEIDKQQVEDSNKPALDFSGSINKAYRDATREAEAIVKQQIGKIQKELKEVKIKLKLDDKALMDNLSKVVNDALKKIAKDTTGLNVNQELEKLVVNLKEVSNSLSGNENFKLGLDEASIERITTAIIDMADMIQRAFGVASNDDIAAQWTAIESKFKAVAGEEGKLLKGNKEHKIAIQELAIEYKKYLDMGGKNDLSELTAHKQTVKNIAAEYENLGKAAQQAAQKQEKVTKKPASSKLSAEEKEAINAVSRENKKLEAQANNTGTALDNESKIAQTAAERFTELAEKKKAATDANLELGIAAEMTTKALKEEMEALKEAEQRKKTNKNAVNADVYESNASNWQRDIKQSLLDSGNYEEVYGAQLSRLDSGTVKFTASVRDNEGAWKKLTATINNSGEIQSTKIQDLTEKQVQKIEREKEAARRLLEQMDGEGVEPTFYDRSELDKYNSAIIEAGDSLKEFKIKKVALDEDGSLSIITEFKEANGQVKTFTAYFDNVTDIIDETTGSVKNLEQALESAFDSGKFTTTTTDFISKAQAAFDKFELKNKGNSNWSQVANDIERVKQSINGISDQEGLDKFKQDLSDIVTRLKDIKANDDLGELFKGENRTFNNINEVRANIDSLFASIGKVNEKSIKVKNMKTLTAEVKKANGEIRNMTVNLDTDGFARFVDNGISEFGRLRKAAEGVFSGIKSLVRIYLSPQDFIRYFRQGFDAVKEIDTAMTELRKVSDASSGQLASYFDEAVESAKELGSSVSDMIGATADWSRMGMKDCPVI